MAPALKPWQGLNPQQMKFVQEYCARGEYKGAAEAAGYVGDGSAIGYQMLRNPQIAAAIYAELTIKFKIEGATLGQKILLRLAKDESAPHRIQLEAAKALLDRGGFSAQRPKDAPKDNDRTLADYSIDELRAMVDKLERDAAGQARDVTPASDNSANLEADSAQVSELLE